MLDATQLLAGPDEPCLTPEPAHPKAFERATPDGMSRTMRELHALVARVGPTPVPVVVTGETGAGKEGVVRRLHAASRRGGPLCVLNCATIPASLIASTLFGHERGAFTGACRTTRGVFEQAHTGTLCLDEIAELPLEAQAALLRVLETGQITRVGGEQCVAVDVRLVASTHRDLAAMVHAGAFRADLWYRLNTLTLHVPPLRERMAELRALAEGFLREIARARGVPPITLDSDVLLALRRHAWPGNVRELRNAMHRAGTLCEGAVVRLEHLPEPLRSPRPRAPEPPVDLSASFSQAIRRHEIALLSEGLRRTGGCKSSAAALLGMPRRTLMRKVKLYRLA